MKAKPIFREKRVVMSRKTGQVGIVEIKIWKIQKSIHYPEGKKFSLFLSSYGKVVIGIDNHQPKGPHLHWVDREIEYEYRGVKKLVNDFWDFVKKEGFKT